MRDRRRCWLWLLVVWVAVVVQPMSLWAAVEVQRPPGWTEGGAAAPESQRLAGLWTDALGLRLVQVLSSPSDEPFVETVAVFERVEPVAASRFATAELATSTLAELVTGIVGDAPPEASELRTTAGGARVVWARWIIDDLAYECVLAPSGEGASVVVMAVLAGQSALHRERFEAIVRELRGATEPMPAFSLLRWRLAIPVGLLLLAALLHGLMLSFVDRDRDHRQAGQRAAAGTLLVLAAVVAFALPWLRGRELALAAVDSSVEGELAYLAVAGLLVAGIHLVLAARLDRGRIRSAPASGVFASGASTAEGLRSSISRHGSPASASTATALRVPRAADGDSSAASTSMGRIVIDDAERED